MKTHEIPPQRPGLHFTFMMQEVLDDTEAMLAAHWWACRTIKPVFEKLFHSFRDLEFDLLAVESARPIFEYTDQLIDAYGAAKDNYDNANQALKTIESGDALRACEDEVNKYLKLLHTAKLIAISKQNKHDIALFRRMRVGTFHAREQQMHDSVSALQHQYRTALAALQHQLNSAATLQVEASEKFSAAQSALALLQTKIDAQKTHHYGSLDAKLMERVKQVYADFNDYVQAVNTGFEDKKINQPELRDYQTLLNARKNTLDALMKQLWVKQPVAANSLFKPSAAVAATQEKPSVSFKH